MTQVVITIHADGSRSHEVKQGIQLRWVNTTQGMGRVFRYKSLKAARVKAHKLVTPSPKRDPDGYAVNPQTGGCLFFQGVTYENLFP